MKVTIEVLDEDKVAIDIPRDFWRYLFAGLIDSARVSAGFGSAPNRSKEDAKGLLVALEQDGVKP